MAHDKVYGICDAKCQVDITHRIVCARISKTVDLINRGAYRAIAIPLKEYGIMYDDKPVAIISPLDTLYVQGSFTLEWTYAIYKDGPYALLNILFHNKSDTDIKNLKFTVAVI